MSEGVSSLEPLKRWSLGIGCLVGIILPLLSKLFPKYDKWIPSAAGLGLSWTFHWYFSLLFLVGAIIGYVFEKKAPEKVRRIHLPRRLRPDRRQLADGRVHRLLENGSQIITQFFHK